MHMQVDMFLQTLDKHMLWTISCMLYFNADSLLSKHNIY